MSYPRFKDPEVGMPVGENRSLETQLLGVFTELDTGVIAFNLKGERVFCTEKLVQLIGEKPINLDTFIQCITPSETTRKQIRQSIIESEEHQTSLEFYSSEKPWCLKAMTIDGSPPIQVILLENQAADIEKRHHLERLERLATIGQITAGAAHEFNNNLTSILGWTQIAMQNTPQDSPAASALDIIEENAHKAKRIFSKLLDMTRSQDEKGERAFVSPEDVLEEALSVLMFELQNAKIELIRRFEPTLPCYLDADGLAQVIVNIVRNGIDAMQERGGGKLEVGAVMDEKELRIFFTDNGPGMSQEVCDHIFDSFFTTKRDRDTPTHGGTGLGLSISQDIIKRMGGKITVESTVGAGSTFAIQLPMESVQPPPPQMNSRMTRPTIPPGAIVLVVDDEPDIGEMIRMSLELQGVSVISVSSGEEAVGQLGRIPFDAAFVDYTMPGLSGHDLGREMQKAQPNLPIVFMSGLNVEIDNIIGDFIKKPFDLDEIQKKLYEVLKQKKESAKLKRAGDSSTSPV